jgi:hypothetical protein
MTTRVKSGIAPANFAMTDWESFADIEADIDFCRDGPGATVAMLSGIYNSALASRIDW